MPLTAKLTATVQIELSTGYEYEADVIYTYDGDDDLRIVSATCGAYNGYDDAEVDEAIYEALTDICGEAYAEWLADRDDYMAEAA